MRRTLTALLLLLIPALTAGAQEERIIVRTFPLQYMQPKDAASLLSPYLMGHPLAGVFEAGGATRAITVRGTADLMTRLDSLIKANDRPLATINFQFQLIAATEETTSPAAAARDPSVTAIGPIEAELKKLFRFPGYRLLSQGTAMASERQDFSFTIKAVGDDVLRLRGIVQSVQVTGGKGSAALFIELSRQFVGEVEGKAVPPQTILSTGLTVPIGQTVVLGSGAYGRSIPALILAVRPEVMPKP